MHRSRRRAALWSSTSLLALVALGGLGGRALALEVLSGTETVSNVTFEGEETVGGTGSGGGGALGGALFVNSGASVTLDSVDFVGNTAIGGTGGVGATGGGLNGRDDGTPGATGTDGRDADPLSGYYGGNGYGGAGQNAFAGADGTAGVGGTGGVGGEGADGANSTAGSVKATLELAYTGYNIGSDSTAAGLYTSIAAAFTGLATTAATGVPPVGDNATLVAGFTTLAAQFTALATDASGDVTAETAKLAYETAWLAAIDTLGYEYGVSGGGGDGGGGGGGGAGSFGYGGGTGGAGGDGGDAVGGVLGVGAAVGGSGGDGGQGGAGGFGAGGGRGGDGGTAGDDASDAVNSPSDGGGGAGGAAGFGGGVGSTADGTPDGVGGGGGSAYGGAIFVRAGGSLTITGNSTFSGNSVFGGSSENGGQAGQAAGSDLFMMKGSTVTLDPGTGNVITFNGSIADDSAASIAGTSIASGQGAGITIASGLVVFNGTNTYTGQTTITGGALQAVDGQGVHTNSNINLAGGVFQSSGSFTRFLGTAPDRVQWTGSGGFAAAGGDLTVRLNAGGALTWGSGSFVPDGSALIFGSPSATHDVHFINPINLAGGTRTIVNNPNADATNRAILAGVISNGSLVLGDGLAGGTIVLTAVNTYAGSTTVTAGTTLALSGAGSIATSSGLALAGTFDISDTDAGAAIAALTGDGEVVLGAQDLTITAAAGGFAGTIGGTGGLTIAGGSQSLSGTNTYSGDTVIATGATLALTGTGSIEASAVTADGTFDISGTDAGASIVGLAGDGVVALGTQTLTVTDAEHDFGGVIGGSGGLTVAGGSQTLSGVNTYTGSTVVESGATLLLEGAGGIASSAVLDVDGSFDISGTDAGASIVGLTGDGAVLLGGERLTITDGDDDSFAGVISGTGGVTLSGGTQTFAGINTYTGSTLVETGATLLLDGAGGIASSAVVDVDGSFDISGTDAGAAIISLSGDGSVLLGSERLTITQADDDSFAGVISGTGGVTLSGGTQTFAGINTYTGSTLVETGATLLLDGAGGIASSAVVDVDGSFDISGTDAGAAIISLSGDGSVLLGAERLTITQADDDSFAGVISGTGGVTLSGGTQTFAGINTYTGSTLVETGATLLLDGAGGIAASAFVDVDGTLDISGTDAGASIISLTGDGDVALGSQTLTLTQAAHGFSGVIDGSGGLAVDAGSQVLTGTNTYTGATDVADGATLSLEGIGSIAQSAVVDVDGTFDISGTDAGASIVSLAGAGSVLLGDETLTITEGDDDFAGVIGGAGGLTVAGGSQTLSGVNTYTGATVVETGASLLLDGAGAIAHSSVADVDGSFDISGTDAGAAIVSLTGDGTVALGTERLTITDGDHSFAGTIGGAGGLTLAGGTQTLTGGSTYSGSTIVATGATLRLEGAGGIAQSALVDVDGLFDISGTDAGAAIVSLAGDGEVALGDERLTITDAGDEFAGTIGGSGGVTVTGGSQTLSGVNTYTGSTEIAAGATLALEGAGAISDSAVIDVDGTFDIAATDAGAAITSLSGDGAVALGGARLTITQADDDIFAGAIGGTGGVTLAGGTQTLSGANTYSGSTLVASGATLRLDGAGGIAASERVEVEGLFDIADTDAGAAIVSLAGDGTVALGAQTLTITDADDLFAGVIGGSGGLAVTGGTQTLSGVNTYTGATSVAAGATLALEGVGGIAASSGLAVAGSFDISATDAGAAIAALTGDGDLALGAQTLTVTDAAGTFSGTIGGSGALVVAGGGQTLDGVTSSATIGAAETGTVVLQGATIDAGPGQSALALHNGGGIATFDTTLAAEGPTIAASFTEAGRVSNVVFGDGTVATANNGDLLVVSRSGDGADGVVNFLIGNGAVATGNVYDNDAKTGGGSTNLFLTEGSSWAGTVQGISVLVEEGSNFEFGEGSTIDGNLTVIGGSSASGGLGGGVTVVNGEVEVDFASMFGNFYIIGDLNVNGFLSPGFSPGVVSVTGNYIAGPNASLLAEVTFGLDAPQGAVDYDQVNIGNDAFGTTVVTLDRWQSSRSTPLGNLAAVELVRVGGDLDGEFVLGQRFVQHGHEILLDVRTRPADAGATVATDPPSNTDEVAFFGAGDVTIVGLRAVIQDETYGLGAIASAVTQANLDMLGSHAERRGASAAVEPDMAGYGWARIGAATADVEDGAAYRQDLVFAQGGLDLVALDGLRAGVLASYGRSDTAVGTAFGDAGLTGDLWSFGVYGTWNDGPAYLDAVLQYGWHDWEFTPTSASGLAVDGETLTVALEGGLDIAAGSDVILTPWAQAVWQSTSFGAVDSAWVEDVSFEDGDSLLLRGGLRAAADFDGFAPYAGVALSQDLLGRKTVQVDGFDFETGIGGTRVELSAGFLAPIGDAVAIYAGLGATQGLGDGEITAFRGDGGLRFGW